MKEAHVGPASNFLPGLGKMCIMSVAKQEQVQESYLPYTSEKIKINRNCLLKILLAEFEQEDSNCLCFFTDCRCASVSVRLVPSASPSEKTACICMIWAVQHVIPEA